jgi:hypothetical protein
MKLPYSCKLCGATINHYRGCDCVDRQHKSDALRDRCKEMVGQLQRNAMLRQGSPVDDLTAFVVSEIGRAASTTLDDSLPLCLYFDNKEDREEFVAAVQEAKPGMVSKRWPA